MRIAFDSNIFIYALEKRDILSEQAQAALRQLDGEHKHGVASTLCFTEILPQPQRHSPQAGLIAQLFLEGLEYVDFRPLDMETSIRAGHLLAAHGPKLTTPDAVHLATALYAGADIFVTNDKVLTKLKIDGLEIKLLGR